MKEKIFKKDSVSLSELKDWADKELAAGTSKEDVAQILLEHTGWHRESVDFFLSKLKSRKVKMPILPKLKEIRLLKEISRQAPKNVSQGKMELKEKMDILEKEINNHRQKFSQKHLPPQKKSSFWKNIFGKKVISVKEKPNLVLNKRGPEKETISKISKKKPKSKLNHKIKSRIKKKLISKGESKAVKTAGKVDVKKRRNKFSKNK